MTKTAIALLIAVGCVSAADDTRHVFKKITLTDQFWGEGAYVGDFNKDGKMDVVSGPHWWEGPDFKARHEYYPAPQTFKHAKTGKVIPGYAGGLGTRNAYAPNFLTFVHDFNADGWPDVLVYGFPGEDASWYQNPQGGSGHWKRHLVLDVVDNESPGWADITGDGKPEIICMSKGYLGYASPDWNEPAKPWVFHPVSPNNKYHKYTHGLGYGDVNGDGREDLLEASGWWEQPKSLVGDPLWKKHEFRFNEGGAQMHVYDVNGDGLNDVITSQAAHKYGLSWFEQVKEDGDISFKNHVILGKDPKESRYGLNISQMHAIDLADMDGDGLKDIITGKRFWAHGPGGDPDSDKPAVVYWFKLTRTAGGNVDYVPHLIDNDSGVGTQVLVADVNGDQLLDVVVGNKKGTAVHVHGVKKGE